jgi:hypothetical protein
LQRSVAGVAVDRLRGGPFNGQGSSFHSFEPRQVVLEHFLRALERREEVFCGLSVATFNAMAFEQFLVPLNRRTAKLDMTPRSLDVLSKLFVRKHQF